MKNNNIDSIVSTIAASTLIVSFTGRDGDEQFEGNFTVGDLLATLTPETFQAMAQQAARSLMHRNGKCEFKPTPSVVNAGEFVKVLADVGAGGSGRFKVTDADTKRADTVLKSHKMAPEQTEAGFRDKYGIEFITDRDALALHYMNLRAAEAQAKRAEASML